MKARLLALVTLIALVLVISVGYYLNLKAKKEKELLYQKIVAAYTEGKIEEASASIHGHEEELITFESACELMLSSYAPIKAEKNNLLKTSKLCFELAPGISHEAYAKAMAEDDKIEEALAFLKLECEKPYVTGRMFAAVANLYIFKKDFLSATDYLIKAIKIDPLKSMWILRAKKFPEIYNSTKFQEAL